MTRTRRISEARPAFLVLSIVSFVAASAVSAFAHTPTPTAAKTPAGATATKTPPAATPTKTPYGATATKTPPGATPTKTPAGATATKTPPGATPTKTPAGATATKTPPGATPTKTPAGPTPTKTPPGATPTKTPAGPTPTKTPPAPTPTKTPAGPTPTKTPPVSTPTRTTTTTPTVTITPTQANRTSTPTESPTTTSTPTPGTVDHFQCYETPRERFAAITGVQLNDRFGASTVTLIRLKRLCNPADKNDEDPSAPTHSDHLTGYVLKQTSPIFQTVRGISVTNQFGSVSVDVGKPDYLLVPTAKSLSGTPTPLDSSVLDHFKCFKTTRGSTRASNINLVDQFGTIVLDVKKPLRLCVPTDKNGEGIPTPNVFLMCYKIVQRNAPLFRGIAPIFIDNQFGQSEIAVDHLRELCVPSTVD